MARTTTKRLVGLLCGYVGRRFGGSLRNCGSTMPTVEEELEGVLGKCGLIRESNLFDSVRNKIRRSSRTDKGVCSSASLWVIKLDLPRDRWAPVDFLDPGTRVRSQVECGLLQAIVTDPVNAACHPDLRVLHSFRVPAGFNPRMGCESRRYEYLLPLSMLPLWNSEVAGRLEQALAHFSGTHCYHNYTHLGKTSAFRKKRPAESPSFAQDRAVLYRSKSQALSEQREQPGKQPGIEEIGTTRVLDLSQNNGDADDDDDDDDDHNDDDDDDDEIEKEIKAEVEKAPSMLESCLLLPENELKMHSRTRWKSLSMPSLRRTIMECSFREVRMEGSGFLCFSIHGRSFIYHQIRKMIGTSLAVASGSLHPDYLPLALHSCLPIPTPMVPGQFLCLADGAWYLGKEGTISFEQQTLEYRNTVIYPELANAVASDQAVLDEWNFYLDHTRRLQEIDQLLKHRQLLSASHRFV